MTNYRSIAWLGLGALLTSCLHGQNLLLNPGFEEGAGAPAHWQVSGAHAGFWDTNAFEGRRALGLSGTGKGSGWWQSEPVALKAGAVYEFQFQGRREADTSGGCVISGPLQANHDFTLGEQWQAHRFRFTPAEGTATEVLRLGQWEQKGTVHFDAAELHELLPVHAQFANGLELGAEESIAGGVYHCQLLFGGPAGNYARVLAHNRCSFNSDRWAFGRGAEVIYAHQCAGSEWASAKLKVNLNYYTGGSLEVAVQAGENWVPVGQYTANRLSGEIDIPPALLGAKLMVRLRGEGPNCNLQVNQYQVEARLKTPLPDARGSTIFLRQIRTSPRLAVHVDSVAWSERANAQVMTLRLENQAAKALNLEISQGSARQRFGRLAPGGLLATNWHIRLSEPGTQEVAWEIREAKLGTLFAASTTLSLGILKDPRPGYALAGLPNLSAWWCESGWKIGRERGLPETGKVRPIQISAARGETEAAQLVLRPRSQITLHSARISPLRPRQGKGGTLAAELLEVAYVQVQRPTDRTGEPGWYPDPLPPLTLPMELAGGANQPLWISVKVDRLASAGEYTGEVELSTSAGRLRVPLAVEVYDFELPRETHLRSGLGLGTAEINRYHHLKEAGEKQAVYHRYLTNFAAHRISPYSFFEYSPLDIRFEGDKSNRQARVDFTRFDQAAEQWLGAGGFTSFMLPLRGMGGGTFQSRHLGQLEGFAEGTPEHARLFQDYLRQIEQHLKDKGWLDKAYTYWFDEPDPKDYQFVVEGMKRIKAAAPGLRRLLTEQPEPELLEHVEIWCGLTPEWTPEKVRARSAAGQEVWWYICCAPTAPYITEFIDHPGAELRLWPWQSWQYGVQGLLIWATTYWNSSAAFPAPQKQDPWRDPMSYVSGYDFKAGHIGYWGNGDGRFLYPPRTAMTNDAPCLEDPVTSLRWENLRDGMEDYEYHWLLRQLVEQSRKANLRSGLVDKATALLKVPAEISRDTRHFTSDPRLILAQRERIARMIEQLSRKQP